MVGFKVNVWTGTQFGAGSEMTKVEPEETVKAVVLLKRVDTETSTNKHTQTGWLAFPRER